MALNEGQYTGEFLVSESPGQLSRDTVTLRVAAETTLRPGTVLGKITASGKYAPYDDGNTDGSEVAAGVLYGEVVNSGGSAADKTGVIVNWSAEVRADDLIWGEGVDDDGGLADLRALGVKAR